MWSKSSPTDASIPRMDVWEDWSACRSPVVTFSSLATLIRTAKDGNGVTVWASFDGGKTWPLKRLIEPGPSAYSSLNAGRPGTSSEGWIYIHYEAGRGSKLARFNLAWLLDGEATGEGTVPAEFSR